MPPKPITAFLSHTKLDEDWCDRFMISAASEGIKVFRSEFEDIKPPAWRTIKDQMKASAAMFLLVGKELVKAQEASETSKEARAEWKYTQNWIAYEVGLACDIGIDVWVCCDSVEINFPVPYLNNYSIYGWKCEKKGMKFIRWVFKKYMSRKSFPIGCLPKRVLICPNNECKSQYNFHSEMKENRQVVCPTCLKRTVFNKAWYPSDNIVSCSDIVSPST